MAGDAPILRLAAPSDVAHAAAPSVVADPGANAPPAPPMLWAGALVGVLVVILLPLWMIASFKARRAAAMEPGVRRRRLGAGRSGRIEATEAAT